MRRHARTKTRQIIKQDLLDLDDDQSADAAEEEKINAEIREDLHHFQMMLLDIVEDERRDDHGRAWRMLRDSLHATKRFAPGMKLRMNSDEGRIDVLYAHGGEL